MKKFALALALSAAAVGSAQAEGFNLGVALGYGSNTYRAENDSVKTDESAKGVVGGLFGSYNMMVSEGDMPFIVGVEVGFDLSGVKGKNDSTGIKSKQKYSLQGVVTLGTKFGGAKTDLRLGYNYAGFEVKDATSKLKKKKGGFLVGLGVSGKVTESMTIGLTYDYTFFGKINFGTPTTYGAVVKQTPRTGVAKLRLAYSF